MSLTCLCVNTSWDKLRWIPSFMVSCNCTNIVIIAKKKNPFPALNIVEVDILVNDMNFYGIFVNDFSSLFPVNASINLYTLWRQRRFLFLFRIWIPKIIVTSWYSDGQLTSFQMGLFNVTDLWILYYLYLHLLPGNRYVLWSILFVHFSFSASQLPHSAR